MMISGHLPPESCAPLPPPWQPSPSPAQPNQGGFCCASPLCLSTSQCEELVWWGRMCVCVSLGWQKRESLLEVPFPCLFSPPPHPYPWHGPGYSLSPLPTPCFPVSQGRSSVWKHLPHLCQGIPPPSPPHLKFDRRFQATLLPVIGLLNTHQGTPMPPVNGHNDRADQVGHTCQ